MNTRFPSPTALLALLCMAGAASCARHTGLSTATYETDAPLKLAVDLAPINRRAADPVSYAPVIKRTLASVVHVYSTRQIRREDIAALLDDPALQSMLAAQGITDGQLPKQRGIGSGIIMTRDGYILTSNHVVDGADEVKISIGESEERLEAKIIGNDALADVAVLKVDAARLVPAVFGDSDQLQVGDVVLAIGNPFAVGQSVSRGIVSAVGRGNLGLEAIEDFIQTDAAINQGNSGGALVDHRGRVVGLNTAIATGSGSSAGVGFAIPINLVRHVAQQLVTKGRVDRGHLGLTPQALTSELAAQFGARRGALVTEVVPDGPAARAGLRTGDVVTRLNKLEIRDPRQLQLAVAKLPPGTQVTLGYKRDGKPAAGIATLAGRPEERATQPRPAHPATDRQSDERTGVLDGVALIDLSPELRDRLEIPPHVQGAIIADLGPASASARQGLRQGDVIREVARKPVNCAEDAMKINDEIRSRKVVMLVWRQGQSRFVILDDGT